MKNSSIFNTFTDRQGMDEWMDGCYLNADQSSCPHACAFNSALTLSSWCNYRSRLHSDCYLTYLKCYSESESHAWLADRRRDFSRLERMLGR